MSNDRCSLLASMASTRVDGGGVGVVGTLRGEEVGGVDGGSVDGVPFGVVIGVLPP